MTRLLIGLRSGLFGFDTDGDDAPAQLFPGIQPLSVAIDPVEPARLYCASYDRGVWRSEDAGSTWLPIGTPQDYFGSRTSGTIGPRETTFVSVSPEPEADGRHAVWVGTEPSRLYRSIDHGETFECVSPLDLPSRARWSFPPRPDTHHVQRIAHGANGWLHVAIEAGAMLRSRDGGWTFEDRLPDSPIDTHVLLTHPLAPGRLYAALGDALFTPGRSFAESRDDGDSWQYSGRGLEAMPYLYGLALNPDDPDDFRVAASRGPQAAHVTGGSSIFRREGDGWIEDAEGFPRKHSLVPVLAPRPSPSCTIDRKDNLMSLNGKIALVTGAATGIGASLAKALALEGALVVGADLAWGDSEQAPGVEQLYCDVSDPSDVERCVADIETRHGPVDILINNAALASALSPEPFEKITPEEWTRVLTVNTIAPFLCSRAVAPRMRERKWGRIVNLTSATIFTGLPPMLHYVSSKGAIATMTRGLARELGADGITVNAIAPGLTMTKGIQGNHAYSEELIAQALAAQSIPEREQPDDLVGACLFLVSDGAKMMTGQILTVDGGTAFH